MNFAYQLNQVQVRYDNQLALDIEQLTIPANQTMAILGDNGAGKSTLLQLLGLLLTPNAGKISFFDEKIDTPGPQHRQRIGLVAQQPYMMLGTVSDNICLALRLQKIDKSLHQARLQSMLESLNLVHLANQNASTLSGGEQRRVAIARALCYQPDVLLLDEPFANLDSYHQRQLEDVITRLTVEGNYTILFSTHDRLQASAITNHAIQLVHGKVVQAALLNLFHGYYDGEIFHTRALKIYAAEGSATARHIAVDPLAITVSTQAHSDSSARNQLSGRLVSISESNKAIRLSVDCVETFEVIISPQALQNLRLSLGDHIWINFKSTAVTLL